MPQQINDDTQSKKEKGTQAKTQKKSEMKVTNKKKGQKKYNKCVSCFMKQHGCVNLGFIEQLCYFCFF